MSFHFHQICFDRRNLLKKIKILKDKQTCISSINGESNWEINIVKKTNIHSSHAPPLNILYVCGPCSVFLLTA